MQSMGLMGLMSLAGSVSQSGLGISSGILGSQAIEDQSKYTQALSELNARMAEFQAKNAIKRGDEQSQRYMESLRSLIGAQRSAMAAQGIEVSSGSAQDVQSDTFKQGLLDIEEIKANAWREAFGYRYEAVSTRSQARLRALADEQRARSTLLTGVMGGLGSLTSGLYTAYQYSNIGAPSAQLAAPTGLKVK